MRRGRRGVARHRSRRPGGSAGTAAEERIGVASSSGPLTVRPVVGLQEIAEQLRGLDRVDYRHSSPAGRGGGECASSRGLFSDNLPERQERPPKQSVADGGRGAALLEARRRLAAI